MVIDGLMVLLVVRLTAADPATNHGERFRGVKGEHTCQVSFFERSVSMIMSHYYKIKKTCIPDHNIIYR